MIPTREDVARNRDLGSAWLRWITDARYSPLRLLAYASLGFASAHLHIVLCVALWGAFLPADFVLDRVFRGLWGRADQRSDQ